MSLYNQGDKTSLKNCRCVSQLNVCCTVLERTVYIRLSHHSYTHNSEHCGFRKWTCTKTTAFKPADSVFKSLNQKKTCWRNCVMFWPRFLLSQSWKFFSQIALLWHARNTCMLVQMPFKKKQYTGLVGVTTVAMEKQYYLILSLCILSCPACNVQVLYNIVIFGPSGCTIVFHIIS